VNQNFIRIGDILVVLLLSGKVTTKIRCRVFRKVYATMNAQS